jgi:hypothetical protein
MPHLNAELPTKKIPTELYFVSIPLDGQERMHGASTTSTTAVNIGVKGGHARVAHLVPNTPEHFAHRHDTVVSMAKRFAGVSKALVFNTNNTQYSCCPVVDGCKLIGVLVGIAERPPRAPGQTDEMCECHPHVPTKRKRQ